MLATLGRPPKVAPPLPPQVPAAKETEWRGTRPAAQMIIVVRLLPVGGAALRAGAAAVVPPAALCAAHLLLELSEQPPATNI